MWQNILHRGVSIQVAGRTSAAVEVTQCTTTEPEFDVQAALWSGRACCCPAKPAVLVIMPPETGWQQPTELLLCWEHYRASQRSLAAARATAALAHVTAPSETVWPSAVSA
jgi:hypothetical protein